jgi:hypothetical protein
VTGPQANSVQGASIDRTDPATQDPCEVPGAAGSAHSTDQTNDAGEPQDTRPAADDDDDGRYEPV